MLIDAYKHFSGQVAKAGGSKHSHSLARTASTTTLNRTTSSSNVVLISSKNKNPNQESNHRHEAPSRGFLEEDEYEERKAALSSPIKGGKRLSSAVGTPIYFDCF
jgi:hypothetical protein